MLVDNPTSGLVTNSKWMKTGYSSMNFRKVFSYFIFFISFKKKTVHRRRFGGFAKLFKNILFVMVNIKRMYV